MRAFKDGNAVCVVLDNFVNLQESPAVFVSAELAREIEAAEFDLKWVVSDELDEAIARLVVGNERAAVRVNPQSLPLYQVYFVLHDEYLKMFKGIVSKAESLNNGTTACWTEVTPFVDFGDFDRKGSVAVYGEFIHDDYRVGECLVFNMRATAITAAESEGE